MKFNIFNRKRGEQLRNDSISVAESGANPEWLAEAYSAVVEIASKQQRFTTDDVWAIIETTTSENRAMGAVMRRAQSDGVISPLEEFRLTHRASNHRRPLRVWESVELRTN